MQSISAVDSATSRPGAYSGAFYNTQGRKFDLDAGTNTMSIDLYIPASWATTDKRMAGFWGTAVDAGDNISFYPILEFTSDTSLPRFRGWNGAAFQDIGLPTGFAYDAWYTLGISLVGSDFVYTVGDQSLTLDANGSESIGNVILQGHNTTDGVNYDIYWDNLQTAAVPEPGSIAVWSLLGLTVGGASWRRRKRSA